MDITVIIYDLVASAHNLVQIINAFFQIDIYLIFINDSYKYILEVWYLVCSLNGYILND